MDEGLLALSLSDDDEEQGQQGGEVKARDSSSRHARIERALASARQAYTPKVDEPLVRLRPCSHTVQLGHVLNSLHLAAQWFMRQDDEHAGGEAAERHALFALHSLYAARDYERSLSLALGVLRKRRETHARASSKNKKRQQQQVHGHGQRVPYEWGTTDTEVADCALRAFIRLHQRHHRRPREAPRDETHEADDLSGGGGGAEEDDVLLLESLARDWTLCKATAGYSFTCALFILRSSSLHHHHQWQRHAVSQCSNRESTTTPAAAAAAEALAPLLSATAQRAPLRQYVLMLADDILPALLLSPTPSSPRPHSQEATRCRCCSDSPSSHHQAAAIDVRLDDQARKVASALLISSSTDGGEKSREEEEEEEAAAAAQEAETWSLLDDTAIEALARELVRVASNAQASTLRALRARQRQRQRRGHDASPQLGQGQGGTETQRDHVDNVGDDGDGGDDVDERERAEWTQAAIKMLRRMRELRRARQPARADGRTELAVGDGDEDEEQAVAPRSVRTL